MNDFEKATLLLQCAQIELLRSIALAHDSSAAFDGERQNHIRYDAVRRNLFAEIEKHAPSAAGVICEALTT